ncbi:MAG: type II toxin-antitoxin system VapC family toxin [Cyanobium sp. LacPavin_0920_WC12_MAG_62_9]|nr:type II toxin-antitoxin system VapC family toxin [Cyanobium sp. LacPavin_0920_WC12_MAG_62_9]MCX5967592.1 type II toxin-antitoxin system VapC family toxin [Cyanobacteriota bacterium]
MAFLLDTHALLWWLAEPERLSSVVHATLADPAQPVFISAASAWEIATKHRLGRLPTAEVLLQEGWPLMESQGFQSLPVSWIHGLRAGSYPMPHRDPFDRLLAAQAELEQLILITLDPALAPFPCQTLW